MVPMSISKISLFICIIFLLAGCNKSVNPDDIVVNEGIAFYKKNHQRFSGYVRSYYPEGKLMSVKEYKKGEPNGYYLRFYKNGQLSLKMMYSQGEPINGYQLYYDNGNLKSCRTDSAEYQFIRRYYLDGKLSMLQHKKNGLLHGTSIQYYHNGSIHVYSNYQNDKKEGRLIIYHPNHAIKNECTYINDTIHGSLKEWNDKGVLLMEEYYEHGKHTGTWKYYYPSGKINAVITFKPNGTVKEKTEYAEDGKILDKFSSQ